jgi:hypothetical protein
MYQLYSLRPFAVQPFCDGLWGKDITCAIDTAQFCPTIRLDPTSVRSTSSTYAYLLYILLVITEIQQHNDHPLFDCLTRYCLHCILRNTFSPPPILSLLKTSKTSTYDSSPSRSNMSKFMSSFLALLTHTNKCPLSTAFETRPKMSHELRCSPQDIRSEFLIKSQITVHYPSPFPTPPLFHHILMNVCSKRP